jgi:hypothetical protein
MWQCLIVVDCRSNVQLNVTVQSHEGRLDLAALVRLGNRPDHGALIFQPPHQCQYNHPAHLSFNIFASTYPPLVFMSAVGTLLQELINRIGMHLDVDQST